MRQVLRVVDRAYLLEAGTIRAPAAPPSCCEATPSSRPISACRAAHSPMERCASMLDIFDIYLLEALINGILLGGVLALLALGLNLDLRRHRRVLDLLRRADHDRHVRHVLPCRSTTCRSGRQRRSASAGGRAWAALLHLLVIQPLLSAPPINQLLATGGVLFFLQSFATVVFGIDFRNIGIRLPVLALGEHVLQLRAAARLHRGLGRHGRRLPLPEAHLCRHRDPRDRPGPADHGR